MTDSTNETLPMMDDLPFGDEARCLALMQEVSDTMAPRRFGLWHVLPDWDDAELVGWGYSDGEEAVLDLPRQVHRLRHRDLPHHLRVLHLHPIWVDREPIAAE
jgi:hypothetical protein